MASFNDSAALNRRGFVSIGGINDLSSMSNLNNANTLRDPLIFPENIASATAYNNHFMIINILEAQKFSAPGSGKTADTKTVQSIVVYMPNTLNFTQNNEYEDVSLTTIAGKTFLGVVGSFLPNLSKAIGAVGEAAATGAKLAGAPINPQTEVLFSNVALRTFQFDFLFAPTSETETETLNKIIKQLRLAAAPGSYLGGEIAVGDFSANIPTLLYEPPQKLNIHFYQKKSGETILNPYLPKLRTSVIESLDFDYAPTGVYSTFSNGYPVSVRMMLRVKEDEVLLKSYVNEGY